MPLASAFVTSRHWGHATTHPFLASVRDGTLPVPAFDAWLVQDHHFVGDLLTFQARLLARAPRRAQKVLVALWAVERAYLDAWSYAAPGATAFRSVVAHWTAPEFAGYVTGLEVAAEAVNPVVTCLIGDVVDEVALAESAFWDMAMAAGR